MKSFKKTLIFSTLALASALALGACGNSNDTASQSAAPSESAAAAESTAAAESAAPANGQTIEVTVEASNFSFEPAEIKAKVGDTLKLTLKNKSGLHGLAVDGLNVDLKDGETAEIVLDKAGTFEYYCSIMCGAGHDNMTGKIVVE